MEGTPDPGIEGAGGMYWAGDPDFPPYPWLKGHGSIEALPGYGERLTRSVAIGIHG